MFLRGYRLCDTEFLNQELETIYGIFRDLSYPDNIIEKGHLQARKTFYGRKKPRDQERADHNSCIVLPYNPNLETLQRTASEAKIKMVFQYPFTVRKTLLNNKPYKQKNKGVYQIPCQVCNLKYFGETGSGLCERMKQHMYDIRNEKKEKALPYHLDLFPDHVPPTLNFRFLGVDLIQAASKELAWKGVAFSISIKSFR
jgi:hypothetical protein